MKTTIEINGFEIHVLDTEEGKVQVLVDKDGETIEELNLDPEESEEGSEEDVDLDTDEVEDFDDSDEEGMDSDEDEDDIDSDEDDMDFEGDTDSDEDEVDEVEDDGEKNDEVKLESFTSFISKTKRAAKRNSKPTSRRRK